jgi:signal transduction histidine kinase
MARESLSQYLRNRLLLVGGILAGIFSMVMYTVYNWGLDDSSEYYLLQDAHYAQSLLLEGQPLPVNTSTKHFYLGRDSLPEGLSLQLDGQVRKNSGEMEYFILHDAQAFIYGIQYPLKEDSSNSSLSLKNIFVLHRFFTQADKILPGMTIFQASVLIWLGVLLVMIIGSALIYFRVSKSMQALQLFQTEQCINGAGRNGKTEKNKSQLHVANMQFIEIQDFALQLQKAFQIVHHQTHKERMLIQGLSHELRTPMAIISVALDLLQKREFDEKTTGKLSKIREANNSMITLANTLLDIWKNKNFTIPQQFFLLPLIQEMVDVLQGVHSREGVYFDIDIPEDLSLLLNSSPLKIVLENLLKNALQYSDQGSVFIGANQSSIWVENKKMNACGVREQSVSDSLLVNYGYGLGLYIAQQACDSQDWQLEVEDTDFFRVTIKLGVET